MRLVALLVLVTLTGCATKYGCPLPPMPQECGWDLSKEEVITSGGGQCEEFIRDYDAARGAQ